MKTDGVNTEALLGRLLLTRDEVAQLLSVKPSTINHLHRIHKLPAVRVGLKNLWKPETVREFVEGLRPYE